MNEVTIPLKVTGIGAIKAELKGLKGAIADATDPAQIEQLTQRAGELADKLKDVNEKVGAMTTGSKFESVSNSFQLMQNDLASLDFEGASEKAQMFASNLGKLGKADISGALKGMGGVVKNLGTAFVKLGAQILMNPIFLLAVVITAIVVSIGIFLNKIGVLDKVLSALMYPINLLIQGFKDLTDWLGLTQYAAEENAAKMVEANNKIQESTKARDAVTSQMYSNQIALLKAQGKDTYKTEVQASMAMSLSAKERYNSSKKAYEAQRALGKDADKEKLKELRKQLADEKAIIVQGRVDRQLLAINDAKADAQQQAENASRSAEKAKQYAKNRLDATRTIKDLELSLILDDAKREEAITKEKYTRLREDAVKNENLTKDERAKLKALYDKQEIADLELQKKKIEETEKAHQLKLDQALKDYQKEKEAKQIEFEELNYQAGLTARQKEEQDLRYHYEQLIADAKQYGADSTNIEAEYKAKQAEQAKKYADEAEKLRLDGIEKAKNERDAKIQFAGDIANGITAIGGMFIKDQKKLEKFNKASALVQIGIDTAKAISSLVAMSQANPANAVTGGGAGIAQFASGIVQIITNVAKAKALLSNPSSTPSAGGGGGGNDSTESTTSVTMATPAIQMFGQGNSLNTQGGTKSANANQNMVVTAVVSESDITNTQTKLSKLQRNAEL